MRKSTKYLLLAAGSLSLMLGGCSMQSDTPWEAEETAVDVHDDGSVTETIVDTLEQSWYDAAELQSMIDSSVAEYNASAGGDAVTVDAVTITDGDVRVQLTYQSGLDLGSYNNTDFFAGSILGAQMEGFLFDTGFYSVAGGSASGELMDNDEPLSHKEYLVVICDSTYLVHVPGAIRYVSEGVEVTDAYTAKASDTYDASRLMYVLYEF